MSTAIELRPRKQRREKGEWQREFLAALANSANVRASCRAAQIERRLAYNWRERDAKFRAKWDEAIEEAIDLLEAMAWERARTSSDFLLWRLLTAYRPDKYGPRATIDVNFHAVDPVALAERLDRALRAGEATNRQIVDVEVVRDVSEAQNDAGGHPTPTEGVVGPGTNRLKCERQP